MKRLGLQSGADVSQAYLMDPTEHQHVGLHSFYGGEIVCGGLITVLPIGFTFWNDPRRAYTSAFDLAFFDIGFARDATAIWTALISRSMAPDASISSILGWCLG